MKKHFVFVCLLLPLVLSAQAHKWAGNWVSELLVNEVPIDFKFSIKPKYEGFVSTLEIPAQNLKAFKMTNTVIEHNTITIESEELGLVFKGKRSDSNSIKGTLTQKGKTSNLVLKRTWKPWPEVKPQTPKPPFSYLTEEVKISVGHNHIMVAGSLTMPDSLHKFPAIIMISGSGAQDRDGSIGRHHPFALLADTFTKMGFAVLRCDDRGAGKTIGSPVALQKTTSQDLADDVGIFMDFLKAHRCIDTNRIGLIGHSEGGIIAPMLAAKRNDVAFMVLLAAPSSGGLEINVFQNRQALLTKTSREKQIQSYLKLHRSMLNLVNSSADTNAFKSKFDSVLNAWEKKGATRAMRKYVAGNSKAKRRTFNTYKMFFAPWWKFFMQYDPVKDLQAVHCPVLALNGTKDNQVPCDPNINIIQASVPNKDQLTAMCIPGLNHLFQTCKTCDLKEYFTLDETFSPQAISIIVQWLNKNVKSM